MRRVLLIDDDGDIREVARVSLRIGTDWEVETAADAVAGLDVARRTRPDAIILDYMMPGVDGPEALRRLRGDPVTRSIPVVFLTAKARADELEDLAGSGAAGVITKPFDPLTLGDEVRRILGWKD